MAQQPLVTNAADPKQTAEAERKAKDLAKQRDDDVKFLLSTAQGRRFFWRYLGDCMVFQTCFDGSSRTFFNEGQRNVGLMMLADINRVDPAAYTTMIKENS